MKINDILEKLSRFNNLILITICSSEVKKIEVDMKIWQEA
jgi:hypothetical protein